MAKNFENKVEYLYNKGGGNQSKSTKSSGVTKNTSKNVAETISRTHKVVNQTKSNLSSNLKKR